MSPFHRFPSTQWTRLEQERASASGTDWFCEAYRPAILSYLRRHTSHHDAEDLCQEFFRRVVMDGPLIDRADRQHGSLRALLRRALSRFLVDYWRSAAAIKRGGQAIHCSLDATDSGGPPVEIPDGSGLGPDRAFDQAWAANLLARALARTEAFCQQQEKGALYAALSPLLDGSGPARRHADIAADLGITSRDVTLALRSLRLRVGLYLHDEVVATVAGQGSVADELEAVKQALRLD